MRDNGEATLPKPPMPLRRLIAWVFITLAVVVMAIKGLHLPFSMARQRLDFGFGIAAAIQWNWTLTAVSVLSSGALLWLASRLMGRSPKYALWIFTALFAHQLCQGVGLHVMGAKLIAETRGSAATQTEVKEPLELQGTVFFGGSGMEGAYIDRMISALKRAGFPQPHAASPEIWSTGMMGDALSALANRDRSQTLPIGVTANRDSEPLTLIGYSHGGLQAAQVAAHVTEAGEKVDRLILIATPISRGFLESLKSNSQIDAVVVANLTQKGDPIEAGMDAMDLVLAVPQLFWQFEAGALNHLGQRGGHFALTSDDEDSLQRLDQFVQGIN